MVSPSAPIKDSRPASVRPDLDALLLRAVLALSLVYYAWLVLDLALHPFGLNLDVDGTGAGRFLWALTGTVLIAVGAFIVRRVPGNSIGPLMITLGSGYGLVGHASGPGLTYPDLARPSPL